MTRLGTLLALARFHARAGVRLAWRTGIPVFTAPTVAVANHASGNPWVGRDSVALKRTVLLATHDFGGFLDPASAAVCIRERKIDCWHQLPPDRAERVSLFEELARAPSSADT